MEKKHYSLTSDEKYDLWSKAFVSFVLLGGVVTYLFFLYTSFSDQEGVWDKFIEYFGRAVSPASTLVYSLLFFWFVSLADYHFYMNDYYKKKSIFRIFVTKVFEKAYDLFPRLLLTIGGCVFFTTLIEIMHLPYSEIHFIYLIYQLMISTVVSLLGFRMLWPRRIMRTDMVFWVSDFFKGVKKIFRFEP
ncbi:MULTISPECIES: hypothetical protein [Pectobacterium]|uniref:hypothetical protein n=1 Tax=Pectobacterium TaxID=122277 RepID=UPI001968E3BF|nr:hypothetical protein [Pectobacterium versatile]MBN3238339.1 hypothetical protein [Pectobacterium versatile]